MKKILLSISICATMMMAASCGKSASYTDNPILGTIPSMCEQFYTAEKQAKDEFEIRANELADDGKFEKVMELDTENKAKRKEKKEEFRVEYAAELAKIAGREVPITYSADLQKSPELFYTVTDAKIIDNDGVATVAMTISAKGDMTVGRLKGLDHTVCFSLIATDGKAITTSLFLPITQNLEAIQYTASQVILGPDRAQHKLSMTSSAAKYVNFAGIEFITHAQYSAIK